MKFASFTTETFSYFDDGINDRWSREGLECWWITDPRYPAGRSEEFLTRRLRRYACNQSVLWGGFASLTLELDNTDVSLLNFILHPKYKDTAVLATNTRSRLLTSYLDPALMGMVTVPTNDGVLLDANPDVSPYVRSEALTYNERYTQTLQLLVTHRLTGWQPNLPGVQWLTPELTLSASSFRIHLQAYMP